MLTSRIAFGDEGEVIVPTGKVEIGQGILAALTHLAASNLQVAPERIRIPPTRTDRSPDEGHTAGSMSVQTSGAVVGRACRQARALLTREAAARLGVPAERLQIADGRFLLDGAATGLDYWSLADRLDGVALDPDDANAPPGDEPSGDIGRGDLRAKITGAGFIQDMEPEGLLHARVVRPPEHGAELLDVDEAAFAAEHPRVRIVRDGGFLAVLCDNEDETVRAAARLRELAGWRAPAFAETPGALEDWLPTLEHRTSPLRVAQAHADGLTRHSAVYSRPGIAHASIGPSCGLAQERGGVLWIWSHSQNVFALRDATAMALGREPGAIVATHVPGAGCYGHNGADDAAFEAALLALHAGGRPVRVQWSREEELAFAPVGAPMAVRIEAGIDASGRIGAWTLELWTMPHARRPGVGGVNLLSATRLTHPAPLPPADEIPLPMGGGDRNAVALYDFPDHEVIRHFIPDPPIRTSSLRALGGHANVFAIESMMDELAEAAGADPLEFRLRHLTEPRGRRVLEAVARLSGWNRSRPAGGEGLGWGLAFARYKNTGGYAAIVAEAAAEDEARITRVWCAADLGRVITRNGALNQIEGGIVQSLSWALYEAAPLGPRGVEARTWKDYPILRFSQTPRITVELVDARDEPPLGAGEVVQGAATAAAANAVAHALGVRVRRLPLSRDHIVAALSAESRTSQSSAAAEQTSREQS